MPHHRKYMFHSGVTLARPLRANSRTSSHASHGFFSRFSRSAFCAFVSFTGASATAVLVSLKIKFLSKKVVRIYKTHESISWVSGLSYLAVALRRCAHAGSALGAEATGSAAESRHP